LADVPIYDDASRMSVAIVAHPSRSSLANALAEKTGAEAVCWDTTSMGCEANHIAAWNWLRNDYDEWGVVLEDDTDVVPDFRNQLQQILAVAPSPVVSLYLGRGHPHGGIADWQNRISAKISADVCWLTAESLLSGQGYAIANTLIPDMLATVTPLAEEMPIDEAISWWCQERGILVSHCRPSIVNHRDEQSLIQNRHDGQPRTVKRTAWLYDSRDKWDNSTTHLTSLRAAHLPES
jgi:GR25 family glycosyltransferase involved in LPS biosynthesis